MAATKRQKRSSAASPTIPATASQASSQDVTRADTTSPKLESIGKVKASEAPTLIIERPVEPPQPAPEPVDQAHILAEPAPSSAAREPVEQTDIPAAPAPILTSTAPAQVAQPNQPERETQASASARSADSLASERAAMFQRRAATIGGVGVLALLIAFLAYRAFAPQAATPAPALAAPTAAASAPAPTIAAAPTQQPAPTAAAAPVAAVAANPTAAPAATLIPQTGGAAASQALTCNAIAGLPVYTGATCTAQDTDHDDGVLKLKNTYMATAAADEVRHFYEASFGQNGLALGDFSYDINLGQRRVKIEVELDQGPSGAFTKVKLTEQGGPAAASATCVPIAQLPSLPNATCIKFKADQDNGLFKTENTYSTSASPEEIRRLYESALAQNGWIGQEFQYELQQGPRRLQIDIEAQPAPQASLTVLKIEEK